MWTFVGLSTVFVTARLYTRMRILRTIGLDDYIIAFSLVSFFFKGIAIMLGNNKLAGIELRFRRPHYGLGGRWNRPACLHPDERATGEGSVAEHVLLYAGNFVVYGAEVGRGGSFDTSDESDVSV